MSRRRAIAAACVSIFMVAGITWLTQRATVPSPPSSPNQPVVFLPEHRMLPDGSRIDFPASTQFMVEFSGPLRRVILRHGEALFQVAKNPARPFVVEAGGVKVRAVGTAFSVQLSRESVEVLVTEGKVRVEPLRTSALVGQTAGAPAPTVGASVVAAGQCTVVSLATTGLMPSIVPVTPEEVARRLAWRNPRVEFSGTPLSAVITVLNRRNRVQFVIDPDSPALGATEVSGLFCTDDTAAFIRMLADGFGVKAEKRGPEEIVLHKEP